MAVARDRTPLVPAATRTISPNKLEPRMDHKGGGGSGPGPKRRLPKMNPSERAKYYRRRMRDYMKNLEAVDAELARSVENLELVRHVQQQLQQLPAASRQRVLAHVWQFMDSKRYLDQHILSDARLEIQEVQVRGDGDGVVLHMDAAIHGVYAQDTIEKRLYPFIAGNAQLLDKLLRSKLVYASSFRLYFNRDGAMIQQTSETDFAAGLTLAIGCPLRDIRQLLDALGNPAAEHRTFSPDEPAPALAFILDDAVPPQQLIDHD